jgi:hypothetical protein
MNSWAMPNAEAMLCMASSDEEDPIVRLEVLSICMKNGIIDKNVPCDFSPETRIKAWDGFC